MSHAEYMAHQQRARDRKVIDAVKRFQALGRLPKDQKNKTEQAYADLLDLQKHQGLIIDWKFHPMNVRLAKNTFYEVDFLVLTSSLVVEIHETKGTFVTEKGQMKIKLCAEALPWFVFKKITRLPEKQGGGWAIEEF